jgi:hypothetical protein
MAATTTKPAYTVRWTEEENERNLRKLFFAAAVDIPDPMMSNLAQPLVRIALKLLELLRAHRAAHGSGGGYVQLPPDAAAQDHWMQTDSDLVESVEELDRSIVLLLFLQKQNLATAIYLSGLGTLLTGLGLKHMRIGSHHDLAGALVTSLLLGRPWWSTTSPTCLPLSVFTITSDQHRCRIPPLL